jgi:hypothetical protein
MLVSYRRETTGKCERRLEELIGKTPKKSIEEMIGIYQTSQSARPSCPALTSRQTDQKLNPGVVNFMRPNDPAWTSLPTPDSRDSLRTIAIKMEALASVVSNGDSMMIWTNGRMLYDWSSDIAKKNLGAEGVLTDQELGELQTTKKVLNISTTRVNEVRAEFNKLRKSLSASVEVVERRRRMLKKRMQA